jgi:hypothetical protein
MPYINRLSIQFEPETADLMRRVFNAAWDELVASASIHAEPTRADRTREALALKVIALVQRGGRNFDMLKREALRELPPLDSASGGALLSMVAI